MITFNFSFEHSLNEIRRLAGAHVILAGNIPSRDVLAAGSPQQVETAVRKAFYETDDPNPIIWSAGGGMPSGVSNANINAFINTLKNCSK